MPGVLGFREADPVEIGFGQPDATAGEERMKAKVAFVAFLVAAHAGATLAASIPVTIDGLDDAAKACGITESPLESVALRTLESSRLQPDSNADGWLQVRVTVTRMLRRPCAAHISVQMKASRKPSSSDGVVDPGQRSRAPEVVLCNEGGDYTASKANLSPEIESAVEQYVRQCLGSLKY
jgi:hypothetical protein